jgi:iron(III) transport system substrate-binding protein
MRPRPSVLAFLAAVGLTVTACGGGTADLGGSPSTGNAGNGASQKVYTQLNGMGDGARAAAVDAARKEGQLNLYTSMNSDVADAVAKAFTQQFGIKVNQFRASSETILQRMLQENQASHPGADVVETNFQEMQTLSQQKLLADFKGKSLDNVTPTAKFADWTGDRLNIFLPAWNTNLIKPGDEPKSWEDLADPRYKGKIQIEMSDSDWYENLTHYWLTHGKTQAQVDQLWQGIKANSVTAKGHSPMIDALAAGQTAMDGMNYSYESVLKQKQGAPVAYKGADGKTSVPGFPRPDGVGLEANAQHPNAAWLFYDWLLTDGQKILVDANQTPVTKVPGDTSLDGVTLVPFDVDTLTKDGPAWSKKYDDFLRGVQAAPQH